VQKYCFEENKPRTHNPSTCFDKEKFSRFLVSPAPPEPKKWPHVNPSFIVIGLAALTLRGGGREHQCMLADTELSRLHLLLLFHIKSAYYLHQ